MEPCRPPIYGSDARLYIKAMNKLMYHRLDRIYNTSPPLQRRVFVIMSHWDILFTLDVYSFRHSPQLLLLEKPYEVAAGMELPSPTLRSAVTGKGIVKR